MAINKASKADENFMNIIRDHIVTDNVMAARGSLAKNTNNSIARMIDKGITKCKPIDAIERSMENVVRWSFTKWNKNVSSFL